MITRIILPLSVIYAFTVAYLSNSYVESLKATTPDSRLVYYRIFRLVCTAVIASYEQKGHSAGDISVPVYLIS